jgi:Amt family ammonium transporter
VLAFVKPLLCAACLVVWFVLDLVRDRRVTAIGAATAVIVGCVGITPGGPLHQPAGGDAARRWPAPPTPSSAPTS